MIDVRDRRIGTLRAKWPTFLLVAIIVTPGILLWVFVAKVRQHDVLTFQLSEAARVVAAYIVMSGGKWPQSLGDLEAAGIVRKESAQEFVATIDERHGRIPYVGRLGFPVDLQQIAIGWGGTAVNNRGDLIAVRGDGRHAGYAALLSEGLRELSLATTSQPATAPSSGG